LQTRVWLGRVAGRTTFEPKKLNAGVPQLDFHDLRHSYASLMLAANVNPHTLKELMGHDSIKVTLDTYGHLYEGAADEAVESLDSFLAGSVKKAAAGTAE
jgi:integrase